MHRALGLSRDPFALVCEEELYWEDASRAALREQAEGLLRAGQGVWLRGAPGSGRRTLLARVGEALALKGRTVAWCGAWASCGTGASEDLLSRIGRVTGTGLGGGDGLAAAAGVYSRLVDGFCRGGPVIVLLPREALGLGDGDEAEILGQLRLVGRPLVALGLWGEGEAPWKGLTELALPPLSRVDVRDLLVHRAAACGRPDLLGPEALGRLSAEPARGLGHALALAQVELARQVFCGDSAGDGPGVTQAEPTPARQVLDPTALGEVERLLDALGPEDPA